MGAAGISRWRWYILLLMFVRQSLAIYGVENTCKMTDRMAMSQHKLNTLRTAGRMLQMDRIKFIERGDGYEYSQGRMFPANLDTSMWHKQMNCDILSSIQSLRELKSFIGSGIYSNLAIDCSNRETEKILGYLNLDRYDASILELPRINIILLEDKAHLLPYFDLLSNNSLIHTFVIVVKLETADWRQSQVSKCKECCVQSSVSILQRGALTLKVLGGISESCNIESESKYSIKPTEALKGIHLRITTAKYFPFVSWLMKNDTVGIKGYCAEILEHLAYHLNFSYTIVPSPGDKYGSRDEVTREWDGMIGMVVKREVDMIMAGITINKDRSEVIDFTFPFWTETTAIVVKRVDQRELYFLKSFHWQVWTAAFGCLVITIIAICLCEQAYTFRRRPSLCEAAVPTVSHISLMILSMMLLKGANWVMKTRASCALWISVWVVSLVVATSYTGNLVAMLSTQGVKLPFRTLQELANDDTYSLSVLRSSITVSLMQEARKGVFAKLWQKVQSRDNVLPDSAFEDRLTQLIYGSEPGAHFGDKTGLEQYLYRREACALLTIPEEILPSGFGIGLPKGSPYTELFSKELMAMAESGLFVKWKKMHFLKSRCDTKHRAKPISTSHVWLLFIITLGCVLLSTTVLCVEIMIGLHWI